MQKSADPPQDYRPPAPAPPSTRLSLAARWLKGRQCTISYLAAKSYDSKLGHVRLPGQDLYTVCEPGLVRRILIEQWERFPKNRALARVLKPLLGEGVVISSGELWKMQRRMIDPAFEEVRLKDVFPLMLEAVDAMQHRLDGVADGSVITFDEETTHVTADIIFRTIFSVPLDEDDAARVFRAFMRYQQHAANAWFVGNAGLPSFLSPSQYLANRSGRQVRGLLEPLVRRRFEAWHAGRRGDYKDILASLLAARDPVTGHVFSLGELVDQVATLFLAGHETTAGALSWSVYLSAACPHVQERLHGEAATLMDKRAPQFSDLKKLKFTRDVFRESLRLYPPFAFIARTCAHAEQMRDKSVAAGSSVTVAPWLIHRHRTHWERPDVFDPDRFHSASGKQSLRQAYLPFSLGPRVCLGASFAMQEAALILSSLVRRYRFEVLPDDPPQPRGRLTTRSANGIRLRIFRR